MITKIKKINTIVCIILLVLLIMQNCSVIKLAITIKTTVRILLLISSLIIVLPDIFKYLYRKIKHTRIHRLLIKGYKLYTSKKYEDEMKIRNKLIRLNPISHNYLLRGYIYEELHKYDAAIADYSQAISLSPNNMILTIVEAL